MHAYLVDQAKRERLLHDGRGVQADDLAPAAVLACSIALTTPSVTNVNVPTYLLIRAVRRHPHR